MLADEESTRTLREKLFKSPLISTIFKLPPFSWIVYLISRIVVDRTIRETEDNLTIAPLSRYDENDTLEVIVRDVVRGLGYAAAFVAPYEQGDILPLRAVYIDPNIISMARVREIEASVSRLAGFKLSLTDPNIAFVHRYDDKYKDNLSIRAVNAGKEVIDKQLFSLFTPIVPEAARPMIRALQDALGVKEVVALPFFSYQSEKNSTSREIVGNLFAVKQSAITPQDIRVLSAFGRQAASAIAHERRKTQVKIAQKLVYELQRHLQNQQAILDDIVEGIVHDLKYVAAMIALVDDIGILTIRGFYINEATTPKRRLSDWLPDFAELPDVAKAADSALIPSINIYDDKFAENLSFRTCRDQQPVKTDSLYSVFRPILPEQAQAKVEQIQQDLGIRSLVAVPFYLHSSPDNPDDERQLVGVLYAASRSRDFSSGEIELLVTFGEQAAASIKNAQIYDISVKRRHTSESFARMAFNATATLHRLKNEFTPIRITLGILGKLDSASEESRKGMLDMIPIAINKAEAMRTLLDNLDKPFIEHTAEEVEIVQAIGSATGKLKQYLDRGNIVFNLQVQTPGLTTHIFFEMLVEVFRVILKNAIDAINQSEIEQGKIDVIVAKVEEKRQIRVNIVNNGNLIPREKLATVFDIHDDTQDRRIGFGLFWAHDFIHGIGGSLTATSNPDDGTIFTIDIPIRDADAKTTAPEEQEHLTQQ